MKKVLHAGAVRQALLLCTASSLAFLLPRSGSAQVFAKGADTGWLQQMEANGFKFYNDQGVAQDCFALLKAKGINSIRLRVWVNPSTTDWVNGHWSPAEVVTMAKRASDMGFRVMIDFHYSDSWADPGQQTKPAAWQNYTFTQLKQAVYDHTFNTMSALAAQGVYPEWVQVGNEIPSGMLWPDGKFSTNPGQLAQLINQGYAAVKAVSANSKVVIHLDRGNNNSLYRSFFDQLTTNGGNYDVIGMSFYPYWLKTTGTTTYAAGDYAPYIANLQTNLNDMVSRYPGKEVIISEVGGDATLPQDTYNLLVAVQQTVKAVPNGKGLGVFYWEPEGYRNFSGYQLSAWGNDGKPTLALNAFLHEFIPLANPSFELNGARATTLTGWSTYTYPTASKPVYTETAGFIGTYRVTHYLATAYQASTYQVKIGLANGTYALSAWVKNSGGQKTCQLYAKNFGGAEMDYTLPVTDAWTQIRLTGIQVSNGQLELGLWSDANAGNYASFDNVELFRTDITASSTSSLSAKMTSAQATTQVATTPATGPADAGISLYPNPSSGTSPLHLALRGLAGRSVTVQVADLLGRSIARQQLTPDMDYAETSLAVPAATPPGMYVLTVRDGARTWTTRWSREP